LYIISESEMGWADTEALMSTVQESEQDYADMESLLTGMLAIDPDERFTPKQALHHPFFVRGGSG
jgi:serine/threonine protein kinase